MSHSVNSASHFGVTKADFDEWRLPREGSANPTRMDNVVWNWLVKTKISAYQAAEEMKADSSLSVGPTWCFDRFGQSSTAMPDGRVIYIGGEHEDYYDPDFHIYNDVIVVAPDGSISIYCYPKEVFPPTDFHSATLVGSKIYVIGSLGYPNDRKKQIERVYVLDTESYAFTSYETNGDLPPWLHKHEAKLSASGTSITVSDGMVDRGERKTLIENLNTWELRLGTLTWSCIKRPAWMRWEFFRTDGARNCLWEIRQALWSRSVGWDEQYRKEVERITDKLGRMPDIDAIELVYRPSATHNYLGQDEENYNTYRINVNGVIVRFVESMYSVQMTVEGAMPAAMAGALVNEVCWNLSKVEGADYSVAQIA